MPTYNDFIPADPKPVMLRPLNKGMNLSDDDQSSPSMNWISGMDVTPFGLRKHGIWGNAYGIALPTTFTGEKFQKAGMLILPNGDTITFLVSNKALYYFDTTNGYSIVGFGKSNYPIVGSPGTNYIDVDGDIETTYHVSEGDYVLVGTKKYLISTLAYSSPNTRITVSENFDPAPSGNVIIVKTFNSSDYGIVDFTTGRGKAYFVDGVTPLVWSYDGTCLSKMTILDESSNEVIYGATAVKCFKDRLYFANLIDGSGGSEKRIRWTTVLDFAVSNAAYYQDLADAGAPLMALMPTRDFMMAFSPSDVYYSMQTSVEGLPYAFFRAETGNIGPVGPRAITSAMNSIMYCGIDDVYVFSYSTTEGPNVQRIATGVADEMLTDQQNLRMTICEADVMNSRIVVAPSDENDQYPILWLFNMKSSGWSVDESATFQTVSASIFTQQYRYSDFGDTVTFQDTAYAERSYISFYILPTAPQLIAVDGSNFLQVYNADSESAADVNILTKSFDFDEPGTRKTFTQMIIRADDIVEPVTVTLSVRLDEQNTFTELGDFLLTEQQNEDILSFRATCRRAMFRLTCTSTSAPWTLKYIILRVKSRGRMTNEND